MGSREQNHAESFERFVLSDFLVKPPADWSPVICIEIVVLNYSLLRLQEQFFGNRIAIQQPLKLSDFLVWIIAVIDRPVPLKPLCFSTGIYRFENLIMR